MIFVSRKRTLEPLSPALLENIVYGLVSRWPAAQGASQKPRVLRGSKERLTALRQPPKGTLPSKFRISSIAKKGRNLFNDTRNEAEHYRPTSIMKPACSTRSPPRT